MLPRAAAMALCIGLATTACSSPPFIEVPNPITGRVTQVQGDAFVLETDAGQRFQFRNGNPQDPDMGQDHMRVHQADRLPVVVSWRRSGYELVAVRIEDGPRPSPTQPTPGLSPPQ